MRAFVEQASRRDWLAGAAALLLVVSGSAARADPKASHTVTMTNMSYGTLPSDVKVGDTIVWVNHDTVPHTVTARDRSFDLRVTPGRSVTMTAQKAGSFPFYCIYHSTMRGTLKVAG